MSKTNSRKRKEQKVADRKKSMKKAANAAKNQGEKPVVESVTELEKEFGINVFTLMHVVDSLWFALNQRIKQIDTIHIQYPNKYPELDSEEFIKVKDKFSTYDTMVKNLCRIKGKLEDLTSKEDKMLVLADHLRELYEAQLQIQTLRDEVLNLEAIFQSTLKKITDKAVVVTAKDIMEEDKEKMSDALNVLKHTTIAKTPQENMTKSEDTQNVVSVEDTPATESGESSEPKNTDHSEPISEEGTSSELTVSASTTSEATTSSEELQELQQVQEVNQEQTQQ